jgi:hypothetical protein
LELIVNLWFARQMEFSLPTPTTHRADGTGQWLRSGTLRIHGELLRLGIRVDERTVSRYLHRPPAPDAPAVDRTSVLRSHRDCLAGMDLFTVPTAATFQLLWVFFVPYHGRRHVLHFAVSDHPEAQWILQRLRQAFPFDAAPRFVLCDRGWKLCFGGARGPLPPRGPAGAGCGPGTLVKRRSLALGGLLPARVAGSRGGLQPRVTAHCTGS